MKKWKEYLMKINGFEMKAVYNEETIRSVFLPLLKQLQKLQKQKGEKAGPDPVAEILQSYRQTPVRHQRPEQPDEIVHHHKNRAH